MKLTVREETLYDLIDIFDGHHVYITGINIESSVIHANPDEMCIALEDTFHYFDQAYIFEKTQRVGGITYSVFDNTLNIFREVDAFDRLVSKLITMKLEAAYALKIDPFIHVTEFELDLYCIKV